MPFDPPTFEAEVTLHLIPTEELPTRAIQAVEAGFDGPHVLRMAVLDPHYPYAIQQALRAMLAELGSRGISLEQAATHLANQRAKRILTQNEDPLTGWSYFHRLYIAGDNPSVLDNLAYALDECDYLDTPIEEQRVIAHEALAEFLDPVLRQVREAERQAAWKLQREVYEQQQAEAKEEWPHKSNSPTRRAILRERLTERARDSRIFLLLLPLSWIIGAWTFHTLWIFLYGIAYVLLLPPFAYWAEYRRMKRERRYKLLRMGISEEDI